MVKGRATKSMASSLINLTPLPDDAFRCLLCEGIMGGKDKYERHLLAEHLVINNRSWLIDQTLVRVCQSGFEKSKEIVNQDVELTELTEAQFSTNEKSAHNIRKKIRQDILYGSKEVNSGEHRHETLTRWVNSAMKKSRVDIKNCHYKLIEEENNNQYRKRGSAAENSSSSCGEGSTSYLSDTRSKELVGLNNETSHSNKNEESPEEYSSSIHSSPPIVSVSTKSTASSPHSVPSTSASPFSNPDPVDEFAYQCPFPQCSFYTDYTGMKTGSAARHGIAEHNISPSDFKTRGLKWRRVSRIKLWRKGGAVP